MISRQQYINKLREINFTFKRQAPRVDLWRQIGGTKYVTVPRSDQIEDEFVASQLRQAGCTQPEIHAFIAACKS